MSVNDTKLLEAQKQCADLPAEGRDDLREEQTIKEVHIFSLHCLSMYSLLGFAFDVVPLYQLKFKKNRNVVHQTERESLIYSQYYKHHGIYNSKQAQKQLTLFNGKQV